MTLVLVYPRMSCNLIELCQNFL